MPGSAPPAGEALPATVEAATATAVLDDEAPRLDSDVERRWQTVVENVNAQKRMLGAFLQESRLVGVTPRALVLAMDHLHQSVVDERENRELVERHTAAAFGAPLRLRCLVGATPAPQPRVDDLKPLVERAIEWFEGEVIHRPASESGRRDG